jgi:cytochrome c peroxidase
MPNGQPLLHDVGTLGATSGQRLGDELLGIDTPTLRGLWNDAPYLHDGSAWSVRAVLDRNMDDAHGVTSDLSPDELDDLAEYVLSLE